jgi:hypothetical protein
VRERSEKERGNGKISGDDDKEGVHRGTGPMGKGAADDWARAPDSRNEMHDALLAVGFCSFAGGNVSGYLRGPTENSYYYPG